MEKVMKKPTLPEIQRLVAEIMQQGFDIAMGGDPLLSVEENADNQNKAYDKAVKENSRLIAQAIKQAEDRAKEKTINEIASNTYSWINNDGFTDIKMFMKEQNEAG